MNYIIHPLKAKHNSRNRTPGRGYLIARPIPECTFLLTGNVGGSRIETRRSGQPNKAQPQVAYMPSTIRAAGRGCIGAPAPRPRQFPGGLPPGCLRPAHRTAPMPEQQGGWAVQGAEGLQDAAAGEAPRAMAEGKCMTSGSHTKIKGACKTTSSFWHEAYNATTYACALLL